MGKVGTALQTLTYRFLPYVPAVLVISFIVSNLVKYTVFNTAGDDGFFLRAAQTNNLPDFLYQRFSTWSGRLTPEALLYLFILLPLPVWRVFIVLAAVSSVFGLSYLTGAHRVKPLSLKTLAVFAISLGIFTFPHSVIAHGIFWVSGSFNYFVPTVALTSALALVTLSTHLQKNRLLYVSLPFVLIAAFQEQTLMALLVFLVVTNIYYFFLHRTIHQTLLLLTVVCVALGSVSLLAPGNHVRYLSEIQTWYPEFAELSVVAKLWRGIERISDHVTNKATSLLLIFQVSLFGLIWLHDLRHWRKKLWKKVVLSSPFIIYLLALYVPALGWRQFNVVNNGYLSAPFINHYSVLVVALALFLPLLSLTYLVSKKLVVSHAAILYLAALASTIMISFSPTIYASTQRVFFVFDYLVLITVGFLLVSLFKPSHRRPKLPLIVFGGVLCAVIIFVSFSNVLHIRNSWRAVMQVVYIND